MSLAKFQVDYLQAMGIKVFLSRDSQVAEAIVNQDAGKNSDLVCSQASAEIWEDLRQRVATCQRCSLYQSRKQTVFGVGNKNADWLIIGEAPGSEEDRQGEPFVGRAGKLLNNMLLALGLPRPQVFIANILKCRPPGNRDPQPTEVSACADYLQEQIDLLKPKIILAVGRVAAQNLLKIDRPIGKMRGHSYRYPGTEIPVIVTYHPAYLLRAPREKRKSWQDLQLAMRTYEGKQ